MDGQSIPARTLEEMRAERIAAIADPKLRQDCDAIVKARDEKLALERDRQQQTYDKRVDELRALMIKSANAPQLTPPGMRSPYLGKDGHERATTDAKAQILTLDHSYLKNVAKEYNDKIDKRLDAPHENQAAREPARLQSAELQRGTVVPMKPVRAPNRYAELIGRQKYAERANQAEPNREKEMDPTRQQQRQRGLQR